MGLCKCPKKKVTNLFCFEHRVNVCEHCLVSNHPKCVVQSYLQWLQDSDYSPLCNLCDKSLTDESNGQCIRLICYDVYHWNCLNKYARQLPANTAPAGYTCPNCRTGIFPAPNVVSPVVDALKQVLSQVNWARAGLGLPMIDEPPPPVESGSVTGQATMEPYSDSDPPPSFTAKSQLSYGGAPAPPAAPSSGQEQGNGSGQATARPMQAVAPQSVVSVGESVLSTVRGSEKHTSPDPRKVYDTTRPDEAILNMSTDHDENKYKRRSAFHWFSMWFKSNSSQKRKDPNSMMKRFVVVLLIGLLGFITIIIIFNRLGRASADSDPFLDPMANPNIRVNEGN